VIYCIPVKYAADYLGIMRRRIRLPLTTPLRRNQEKIEDVVKTIRDIKIEALVEVNM